MAKNPKPKTDKLQPIFGFILSPKRVAFLLIAVFVFTGFVFVSVQKNVYAATGINQTINFQGKVVNSNGTNVADGQYTFVFKLHTAPTGGSNPWTETQNNVQVTAGIFRVSLGSVTPITGVDFNTDNIYLGVNFNSDGEMTPRVRFASVPYAFNAQKVAGLTVTDTTGTLTIPNSKVVQFGGAFTTSAQDLTLTLSGTTNLTLPTTGTLATLGGVENLSNKTFTTSITLSGVTTDITTGSNEDFSVAPNGTGKVNINTTSGTGSFNVRPNGVTGGTLSVASVSGATSFAALLVDNSGFGDIFTASKSGATKFVIKNDGTITLDSANYANCGSLVTDSQALVACGSDAAINGDTLLAVYVISSHAGNNLTINFNGLVNTQPSSASGVISFPSNASKLRVEARGGGGGGGGTGAANAIKNAGGGGEGGYSSDFISNPSSTYYLKVGGGGAGGAAGGINSGAQGTSTCLGTNASDACNGAIISDTGGFGGAGINSAITAAGGIGGGATGGDFNNQGQSGFASGAVATANFSGAGGGAGGARSVTVTPSDGFAGTNGGGGSGAGGIAASVTTRAGGRGGDGYIIFYVYKNGDTSADGWNQFGNGVIAPSILTTDVLLGGTTTQSARIGFINVAVGTPTASISATNGSFATYLTGDGNLSTTNNATLTIGGGSTGNVLINPLAGALVGIGTQTPNATFDLRYASGLAGGTLPVASISGRTSNAVLVVDNSGLGDLFVASSSGVTQFVIRQNGSVGIGLGNSISPTAKLDVNGNASVAGAMTFRSGAGSIQTTANNTLSIGGSTTGDIQIIAGNKLGLYLRNNGDVAVGPGLTSTLASLDVRFNSANSGGTQAVASVSGVTSYAAFTVDNRSIFGDLFTASSSSNTQFVIKNNGAVGIGNAARIPTAQLDVAGAASISGALSFRTGAGSIQTTANNTLTIGGSTTGTVIINPTTGGSFLGIGTTNPKSLVDIQGLTTAVASISATTNGNGTALVLGGDGSLGTVRNNTLTIGGGPTGNVLINPLGAAQFGIGTTSPLASIDLRGSLGIINGGTLAVASVSGRTSNSVLSLDNFGVGDIFTASSSSNTQFVIRQNGAVGIGNAARIPTAQLDVAGAASISGVLSFRTGAGSIQTTANNTLTIGGSTTGNVIINPTSSNLVGIGTTAPKSTLDVRYSSGTLPVASISGRTSLPTLIVDNGVGDIIAASSSGLTRFVVRQNGRVGIGTATGSARFEVLDFSATYSALLANQNQAAGSRVLGLKGSTGTTNRWIDFMNQNGLVVGKVRGNGTNTALVYDTAGGDYAEWFKKADPGEQFEYGDLVCMTEIGVSKCDIHKNKIIGAVTDNPGFVGNSSHDEDTENYILVGLVGQIRVNVSASNGEIKGGDEITVSDQTGIGIKALKAGYIVGRAEENFDGSSFDGKVLVSIQSGSFNGAGLQVLTSGLIPSANSSQILAYLLSNSPALSDNGVVSEITTDRVIAGLELVTPRIVTDTLGVSTIESSNGSSVNLKLDHEGSFKVNSPSGESVITFDAFGNATFSGTLTATKILAGEIDGLEVSKTKDFAVQLESISAGQLSLQESMASISARIDRLSSINILNSVTSDQDGDLFIVNNFAAYGITTLSQVSVLESLSIGSGSSLSLSKNTIDSFGDDLLIQPLKQSAVSFLGGYIRFETDGRAVFAEDVLFEKDVSVKGVLSAQSVYSQELKLRQGDSVSVSDTEVISTSAAGLVTLRKQTDHVKVNNPLVKENSYIFISPKTRGSSLFLIDQVEGTDDSMGSFTVGSQYDKDEDIKFNYLIVN